MDWIVSPIMHSNYIMDDRLKNERKNILITYETLKGRRYVKQAECYHGYIAKKVGGEIIAWMFCPKPFDGK